MSESYKLIYFNLRGRAEGIRFIFHYAGVPYEEVRVELADWPFIKESLPAKQVPVLEITRPDGQKRVLTQSMTIGRYLARKFKLIGADEWESAMCDEIADTLQDVGMMAALGYYESDPDRKHIMYQKLKTETIPSKLGYLERRLKTNGGNYMVGKKTTWADLNCAFIMKLLEDYAAPVCSHLATDFPAMTQLRKSVESLPGIAAYLERRPNSDH